jgi:hypothetical protein
MLMPALRSFSLPLVLSVVALVATPRAARAQEEPPPEATPDADWQDSFQRGLDLLRDRKCDESIAAFENCRKLNAKRALDIVDYNIACAYSQKKAPERACEFLKRSFDEGFLDLEHVARDTDLDPIRDDPGFQKLVASTRQKVLDDRPKAQRLVPKTAASGKRPLLVYLPSALAQTRLDSLAEPLGAIAEALGCVILVEQGHGQRADGLRFFDSAAETCVAADVASALADPSLDLDPKSIVVAGDLEGGTLALSFGLEHHWKGVVAAGQSYSFPSSELARAARVYLVLPFGKDLEAVTSARDFVLDAGGTVAVERRGPATPDQYDPATAFLPALERAARWVLGESVKLPGAGESASF